ncbi:MAG: hypothetical protein PUE75_03090, partial [Eubacteriales bacterium]|nr:hypothetical protein [Eubacteriales bacterium]
VAKETKQRFVCDCSQCEIKGAIRIGSGQNFRIALAMNKILGTATVGYQSRGSIKDAHSP